MVASQLPFAVALPKALKNSCFAAVFGFLLLGCLQKRAFDAPRNKKPALFVRAL